MRKTKFKSDIIQVLKQICDIRPNTPVATHISTALMDYPTFDMLPDKELFYLLEKYRCTIELDISIPHESDIEDIINDAQNLSIEDYDDEEVY